MLGLGPDLDLNAGPDFDLNAGPDFDRRAGPDLDFKEDSKFGLLPDFGASCFDMMKGFKVSFFTILVKNTSQT